MFGPLVYSAPPKLYGRLPLPFRSLGFTIVEFDRYYSVQHLGADVAVGAEEDGSIVLAFSAPMVFWGKNLKLAEDIERVLFCSGAKVYVKGLTDEWVYRLRDRPSDAWCGAMAALVPGLHYRNKAALGQEARHWLRGELRTGRQIIGFVTGPGIDAESAHDTYYIAFQKPSEFPRGAIPEWFTEIDGAILSMSGVRLETRIE